MLLYTKRLLTKHGPMHENVRTFVSCYKMKSYENNHELSISF